MGSWSLKAIEQAIADGLQESPWLDAKRELGRPVEAAKDVAAMANEGGVLLYGVVEDDDGALAGIEPMADLARFEERLANAVRDSIHNAPDLSIQTFEVEEDAGVAVVVVPRSPLAPHLVDTKREGRFYGRTASTTRRLTGAQVEMYLQRRRAFTADVEASLESATRWRRVPAAHIGGSPGQVTVVVEPAVPAGGTVERAGEAQGWTATQYLSQLFQPYREGAAPLRSRALADASERGGWQIGADIFLSGGDDGGYTPATVELEVGRDGRVEVRSLGAVIETVQPWRRPDLAEARPWCDEWTVASVVAVTLAASGRLLADAGQLQQVTCSVHVDQLEGASSWALANHAPNGVPRFYQDFAKMVEPDYVRHLDVSSRRLLEAPADVARLLLRHLFEALAQGPYPPGGDPLDGEPAPG